MEERDEAIGEGKSERRVWLVEDTEKERVETTRELQRSEVGKDRGENGLLWGVDVMALWGKCLQGAKGPQSGGTGRRVGRDLLLLQRDENGAKTGPETNPSLPPLSYSHRHKLPEIPFTKSPADCSQSPESRLT